MVTPVENEHSSTCEMKEIVVHDGDMVNESKKIEMELHLREEKDKNMLTFCCSGRKTDRRLLNFMGAFSMSLTLLIFSMFMVSVPGITCDTSTFYTGMMSMIVGFWLNKVMQR